MSLRPSSSGRPPFSATHVDAEARLQRREAVELVQHHVGDGVALELDDDAHAVAVAFVADVGDALDPLVAHELGDLLDHRRLVHLVRNLGDDDRFALLADRLDMRRLAAHHDRAAPGLVGGADAGAAEDDAAGREIRARARSPSARRRRSPDRRSARCVASITSPRLCGGMLVAMPTAMPPRAVDQQVRESRRQDRRLAFRCRRSWRGNRRCPCRGRRAANARPWRAAPRCSASAAGGSPSIEPKLPCPSISGRRMREVLRHAHQRVVDRAGRRAGDTCPSRRRRRGRDFR